MTARNLFDAIGLVDDELIEAAARNDARPGPGRGWLHRWPPACAWRRALAWGAFCTRTLA